MSYYLLVHKNPHGDHFYTSRQGRVLAIVLHVTAGLEDLDGIDDHSAENTARYAATTSRQVSWHSGSDSDSALDLLPASYTAFHVRNYNSKTYGHEISKHTADWRPMSPQWVDATLWNAAVHLASKVRALGIPVRKATRGELDRAITANGNPVGFIGHWELDPSRRSDPGRVDNLDTFPWSRFLAMVAQVLSTEEEDVLIRIGKKQGDGTQWAFNGVHKRPITKAELDVWLVTPVLSSVPLVEWPPAVVDAIPDAPGN